MGQRCRCRPGKRPGVRYHLHVRHVLWSHGRRVQRRQCVDGTGLWAHPAVVLRLRRDQRPDLRPHRWATTAAHWLSAAQSGAGADKRRREPGTRLLHLRARWYGWRMLHRSAHREHRSDLCASARSRARTRRRGQRPRHHDPRAALRMVDPHARLAIWHAHIGRGWIHWLPDRLVAGGRPASPATGSNSSPSSHVCPTRIRTAVHCTRAHGCIALPSVHVHCLLRCRRRHKRDHRRPPLCSCGLPALLAAWH